MSLPLFRPALAAALLPLLLAGPARASIAYGSINNFDTVNDTGVECHGFEIELDDCHSVDISYTYDYNHYGVPEITQDDSLPGHPRVFIRWRSARLADGSWAAYTAIPSGPIAPTDGHMFTDPSVNFGGEHFGVGYNVQPSAISYHWLVDDGAGNLVRGPAVQVATPDFTYYPPVPGDPAPAQVQAVIVPPDAPRPPAREFGDAVWVREIRTTTHNNRDVGLRDLVSDDPDDDHDRNWRNGEPDEVEVEWRILQRDYNKADGGANAELAAAPENLDGGDEVVTRRYEFYKYTGPFDGETGEALAESVGPDDVHGAGLRTIDGVEVDLATIAVVGDYIGAQMSAVDVDAPVGLVDHLQDGAVGQPYTDRRVVVEGARPFIAAQAGSLPFGLEFDAVTGILSGTPLEEGEFAVRVTADDGLNPPVEKTYLFAIAAAGAALPPVSRVDTRVAPVGAGLAFGDGSFAPGSEVAVQAEALPGFVFVNWTDNGIVVGSLTRHTLVADVNHSLVANFRAEPGATNAVTVVSVPAGGGETAGAGYYAAGSNATVSAFANAGYVFRGWTRAGEELSAAPSFIFPVASSQALQANFALIVPRMDLASAANGTPCMEWPAGLPGWVLEECRDLAAGDWVDSTLPVEIVGDRCRVSVDAVDGPVYLRLRHP